MGLLDLFSKLIVEHGSAEVQNKHIALFRDQLAAADKRITELEFENAISSTKLEKSESDLQESQKENEILRSNIQEYVQSSQNSLLTSLNINEFIIQPEGFYTHSKYKHAICPRCLHHENPKVVPMTQASGPWKCVFCDYKISPKATCVGIDPPAKKRSFVRNW